MQSIATLPPGTLADPRTPLNGRQSKPVLLVAEDNDMDALLLERVLERSGSTFLMQRVPDGEQAIAYLEGTGAFRDRTRHPLPDVLLLDLKMPRKDGFDVLRWRQQVTTAKFVPVVVFSSSNLPEDVQRAYSLGANSYVAKPSGPQRLDRFVRSLQEWWADLNLTALTPL